MEVNKVIKRRHVATGVPRKNDFASLRMLFNYLAKGNLRYLSPIYVGNKKRWGLVSV